MDKIKWTFVDNNNGIRVFERYGTSRKSGRYEFLLVHMANAEPNSFCLYRSELGEQVTRTAHIADQNDLYRFASMLVESFLDDTGTDPIRGYDTDANNLKYVLSDMNLKNVELDSKGLLSHATYFYPEDESSLSKTSGVGIGFDIKLATDFPHYLLKVGMYKDGKVLDKSEFSFMIPIDICSMYGNDMLANYMKDDFKMMALADVDKKLRNIVQSRVETFRSLFGV